MHMAYSGILAGSDAYHARDSGTCRSLEDKDPIGIGSVIPIRNDLARLPSAHVGALRGSVSAARRTVFRRGAGAAESQVPRHLGHNHWTIGAALPVPLRTPSRFARTRHNTGQQSGSVDGTMSRA